MIFTKIESVKKLDPYSFLKPCVFVKSEDTIYCSGDIDTKMNIKEIFVNYSQHLNETEKHFTKVLINNNLITELEENTFNDITFDEILIWNSYHLKTIHRNAFTATSLVTKTFRMIWSTHFESSSIFEVLSRFLNVQYIEILYNGITEIPSNAFQPILGYQKNLTKVKLSGGFTKIGSRAFSNLIYLNFIEISLARFDSIPDYAFEFKQPSNTSLTIYFSLNFLQRINLQPKVLGQYKKTNKIAPR